MIEYEDLLKQLQQFRLDVIAMLSEQDIEVAALEDAVTSGKPISKEDFKQLRNAARKRKEEFEKYNSQHLALLHERRDSHS